MISYDQWLSQILGNYNLTTSTKYRTKLVHEYTIYYHISSRSLIVIYTTVSVWTTNVRYIIVACTVLMYEYKYTVMSQCEYIH